MRIENIEIQNFRQYRNLSFKFPHSTGDNDLHIIFANNGVGKTNVLNAITWCLYDTEMHLGDKNTALAILNNQKVQELREHLPEGGNAIGDATVRILFSSDDGSEKIRFQRVGKFNVTSEAVIPVNTEFSIMHFAERTSQKRYMNTSSSMVSIWRTTSRRDSLKISRTASKN